VIVNALGEAAHLGWVECPTLAPPRGSSFAIADADIGQCSLQAR
jgi:hypothetical protein